MTLPEIRSLDRAIKRAGQSVVIKRPADGSTKALTIIGAVRGYKPTELVGNLKQGDSLLVISPTDFAGWGGDLEPTSDFVEYNGRTRAVQAVDPVYVRNVLVRLNVTVRG